jgi:hypothetical protein
LPLRSKAAFTLVEAIIGAFLLLMSLLVVAALVDSSLRTQAKAEQYLMASMVASSELDKLRAYADRFGMAQLDGFDGQSFPSESEPELQVRLSVRPQTLYLPNSSLESHLPEAERKAFENSARLVTVRVGWSDGGSDAAQVATLVTDWRPADFEVEVTADGPLEVGRNQILNLKATAGEIPDIVYTWYTEPLTGLGSIGEVARDGQTAQYIYRYRTPAGRFDYYAGQCRVVVRAQYRNAVKTGSLVIDNVD